MILISHCYHESHRGERFETHAVYITLCHRFSACANLIGIDTSLTDLIRDQPISSDGIFSSSSHDPSRRLVNITSTGHQSYDGRWSRLAPRGPGTILSIAPSPFGPICVKRSAQLK